MGVFTFTSREKLFVQCVTLGRNEVEISPHSPVSPDRVAG